MSKIGKQPIEIPDKVEVQLEGGMVKIKGPKGSLEKKFPKIVTIEQKDKEILVSVTRKDKMATSLHGTVRSILANVVKGVTDGWSKKLELVGTGYRAEVQGDILVLTVGYINPVKMKAPEGISFKVEKTEITVEGIDKEVVGEVAAKIRAARPPEPYQGKGIRYKDEVIKKKPGKAAKAGEAA
jgi:large subunit ribosomal protein L6